MNDFEITAGRLAELLTDPLYSVFCFASRKARGLVVGDGRIDLRKVPGAAILTARLYSGLGVATKSIGVGICTEEMLGDDTMCAYGQTMDTFVLISHLSF